MVEERMNIQEVDRLRQWMQEKGFSAEEILKCISYIAGDEQEE